MNTGFACQCRGSSEGREVLNKTLIICDIVFAVRADKPRKDAVRRLVVYDPARAFKVTRLIKEIQDEKKVKKVLLLNA